MPFTSLFEGQIMPTEACEIDRRIVNRAEKMAEVGYNGTYTFKDYGIQEKLSLGVPGSTTAQSGKATIYSQP